MESTGDVIFFGGRMVSENAKKAKEKKKGLVGEIKTIFKHVFV